MASSASDVSTPDPLRPTIQQRWELAGRLMQKALELKHGEHIRGMQRVERKIKAEKAFLESLLSEAIEIKEQHISSSNLLHLEAILHVCEHAMGVVAVQQSFCYIPSTGSDPRTITVDVVASDGNSWVRVFARNRRALHQIWLGNSGFGDKSVTDVAQDYLEASHQNPYRFEEPKVVFVFFDGITQSIAAELQALGVHIVGPVFSDDSTDPTPSPLEVAAMFKRRAASSTHPQPLQLPQVDVPECTTVNLDVSTMLAWASALTHGGAHYQFDDPVIDEQAQQEQMDPVWPKLEAATKGKKLLACRTAVDNFRSILETVGGPEEKERGRELLAEVEVVEDAPSSRAMALECSGKIKPRAKIIFGTGDTLKAMTVTANEAFVRAAAHQGVSFDVLIHPSRALTEAKQVISPSQEADVR